MTSINSHKQTACSSTTLPSPLQNHANLQPHPYQLAAPSQMAQEPIKSIASMSKISIPALLTPPNSEGSKLIDSFDHAEAHHDRKDSGILFPEDISSTSPAPVGLFNSISRHPVSEETPSSSVEANPQASTESVVRDWSLRDSPRWEDVKGLDHQYPPGVRTWKDLQAYEATRGISLSKPTTEEYELVANFFRSMRASSISSWSHGSVDVEQRNHLPHSPARKVLKDKSSKRRSLANLAPVERKRSASPNAEASPSPNPSTRRRSSKVTAKGSGSEPRSARAASTKPPKDPDWWNYPDYAPSFAHARDAMSHANNARHFDNKDNKKGPRDLTDDKERHHLHPSELVVASWLHLDCHRYHTSKRQIFQGYVDLLRKRAVVERRVRDGLEERGQTKLPNWNKTEAQKTLGIDVSKGSWIWQFYTDLGWFNKDKEHLYDRFIQEDA